MKTLSSQRNVIEEYAVKLSAVVDNEGLQQLLRFLDTSKLKAIGLSAALAGVTAGIFKFIEASTAREFEMAKLAKQQHKSLELTRAENNAMKAMGKTMAEINKDENLKKIYKDVVAFNKELQMPNVGKALDNVRNLEIAFTKLKSVINSAVQWINAQVLINLERPIERLTGKAGGLANWLKDNMKKYAPRIATWLSDFAKGIMGILDVGGKVLSWLNSLPPAIKSVGTALLFVVGIIKGGTIGRILALLTLVGDVIHDADNYKWNQENEDNTKVWAANNEQGYTTNPNDKDIITRTDKDGNKVKVPYKVDVGLTDIWDIVFGDLDDKTKAEQVTSKIVDKLTTLLQGVTDEMAKAGTLDSILGGENSLIGQILGGISSYFRKNPDKVGEMISALFGAISEVVNRTGGWGAQLISDVAGIIAGIFNSGELWEDSDLKAALNGENGIVNGLMGALELNALGASPFVSILGGIFGGYKQERDKALKELFKEEHGEYPTDDIAISALEDMYGDNPELTSKLLGSLQGDFNEFISGLLEGLAGGFKFVGQGAGYVTRCIINAMLGNSESEVASTVRSALGEIDESNPIWNGVSTGIAGWIASGNFLVGILSGLTTTLFSAENTDELKKAADEFVEFFNTLWLGAWNDPENHDKGRNGVGLKTFIDQIIYGEDGEGGIKKLFVDLGSKIGEWLAPVGDAISEFFSSLWLRIYNEGPQWLRSALGFVGINNPNTSSVEKNEEGGYTLTSSSGGEVSLTDEQAEVLSPYLNYIAWNNANKEWEFTNGASQGEAGAAKAWLNQIINGTAQTGNHVTLQQLMSGVAKNAGIESGTESVYKYGGFYYRQNEDGTGQRWNRGTGEWVDATEAEMKVVQESAKTLTIDGLNPLAVSAENAAETFSAIDESLSGVAENVGGLSESIAQAVIAINKAVASLNSGKNGKAWGGRIGGPGQFLVGEDGPEYIIPVTKPERAMSLINQALSEMGMGTVGKLSKDLGIGTNASVGTLGGSLDSLIGSLGGGMTNISAPVTIYVTATGADGEEIGTTIYDAAERHLTRTLRGVCG